MKVKKFNSTMKLKVSGNLDELSRVLNRARVASNAAIREQAATIRGLHLVNKEDFKEVRNALSRAIYKSLKAAGVVEAADMRGQNCINPIWEHVGRMKAGTTKSNGRGPRLPRVRVNTSRYQGDKNNPGFALILDDDGDLAFAIPTDITEERQPKPEFEILAGHVSGGNKVWQTFKVVDNDRVREYLQRYAGMALGSATINEDHRGEFYVNISWTSPIESHDTSRVIGIDVGKNIPLVCSEMGSDGVVSMQWQYDSIWDIEEAAQDIASYAAENDCSVVMENLKGLGRVSMKWMQFKPGKLVKIVERECDKLGVPFLTVLPRYTSQRCSCCGTKGIREKQEIFICTNDDCEVTTLNADENASVNIGHLALGLWDQTKL